MNLADFKRLSAQGESEQFEFKKSMAQLNRGAETRVSGLCDRRRLVSGWVAPATRIPRFSPAESHARDWRTSLVVRPP